MDHRRIARRLALLLGGAGVLGGLAGALVFSAYIVGKYKFTPFIYIDYIEQAIFGSYWEGQVFDPTILPSIFFDLEAEYAAVPVDRRGTGGGLTSFGDEVLLVTHEGRIFSALGPGEVTETAIRAPDNGFEAYRAAAGSERFRDLTHNFEWFRYNDILVFEVDGQRGLALSYTHFDAENVCYANRVAVLEIPADAVRMADFQADPGDWRIAHTTRPCLPLKKPCRAIDGHMAGGRMAFAPPATLYLASGDYHWDGQCASKALSQDLDQEYGKILAIDLKKSATRIISIGHRNMQGIVVDAAGEIWVVEHGARGGDELNRIVEGANYGWPLESLGTGYDKLPIPTTLSFGRHEIYQAPIFAWLPSVAISSLIQVDGFDESWDGDLVMGTLRSESLFHIRTQDGRVLFSEQIPVRARVRYVHQHTDGRLVLWTDDHQLVFLSRSRRTAGRELVEQTIVAMEVDERTKRALRSALQRCNECHSLEPGDHVNAPSLARVFDAPIAASVYAGYSPALRAIGGRWTRERLAAYLSDPEAFAPGTSMPAAGIDDPETLERLIDVLERTSDAFD